MQTSYKVSRTPEARRASIGLRTPGRITLTGSETKHAKSNKC